MIKLNREILRFLKKTDCNLMLNCPRQIRRCVCTKNVHFPDLAIDETNHLICECCFGNGIKLKKEYDTEEFKLKLIIGIL